MAVLEELDPRDARRSALGPYFGFVGATAGETDPRARPVYVTRFEHLARCPWQAFLQRVLRLEPVADAAGDLPRADDPLRLGKVVHRVLERVAQRSAQDASALARDPLPMEWPDGATLDAWLIAAAEEELRTDAVSLAGYDRVLTRRARPYLERARECDWREGPPLVVATEVDASAQVTDAAGRPREIRFKADRVDREDGHLVFTDYKTGKPLADQLDPARRLEGLRKKVAAGRALQALLYARSGGAGARGRYLFLSEKAPEVARALEVEDAPPLAESFDAALRVLLEVWDRGSFLPRLREADRDEEPGSCRFCDVRDACLRGDSGARARLERWGEAQQPRSPAEDAADAVYRLGTQP
jgi:RecB family exonuclease